MAVAALQTCDMFRMLSVAPVDFEYFSFLATVETFGVEPRQILFNFGEQARALLRKSQDCGPTEKGYGIATGVLEAMNIELFLVCRIPVL